MDRGIGDCIPNWFFFAGKKIALSTFKGWTSYWMDLDID